MRGNECGDVGIGAKGNDGNGTNSGHVRVYQYDGAWVQIGQDIDGEAARDKSGWSVSLSNNGTIVAIGAHGNDDNGSMSGHVRVYGYDRAGVSWDQLGQAIDGEASYDKSGWSGSWSNIGGGDAIGAGDNDDNGDSTARDLVEPDDDS